MKKIIYIFIIFIVGVLFTSCSKDKGNYEYTKINTLDIKGIAEDTTVSRQEILNITPKFNRNLFETEEGLEYSWTFRGEEVSKERNLSYEIPASASAGEYDCHYVITDTNNGMKYFYTFYVNVVSSFSWGYYFLCEGENKVSELYYFSTKEGTKEAIRTTKVGDYELGFEPQTIFSSFEGEYWQMSIISKRGENPVIVTDNGAFMPSALVNSSSFIFGNDSFEPTGGFGGSQGTFFISNGKTYSYNEGLLYRAGKQDREYDWSNPISYHGMFHFAFDEISKKYYCLKPQINDPENGLVRDGYALDRIVELADQPDYTGRKIICSSLLVDDIYNLTVATAKDNNIDLISYKYIDNKPETDDTPGIFESGGVIDIISLPLAGANSDVIGCTTDEDWYFFVGNKVYTSPVLLPKLTEMVDLPSDLGKSVSVDFSGNSTHLVVAYYDENSSNINKGSFVLINLQTKEVTVYRNVIGKCICAKGFDTDPWS